MLADPASPYAQPDAAVAFGWALDHALELAPTVGALVVVDVLRFTTCVSVACARGATIFPYEWNDNRAQAFAARHGAQLAGLREHGHLSLSPTDLLDVPAGLRLVLPSPNGSAIAYRAADAGTQVIAGSLRNARAVAAALAATVREGGRVAVIAAGERWKHSDELRPAVEDHLGAGAVIARLVALGQLDDSQLSPEAHAAGAS